jgi:hypothetical protein
MMYSPRQDLVNTSAKKMRIKLKAYDHPVLDQSAKDIVGATVSIRRPGAVRPGFEKRGEFLPSRERTNA